MNTKNILLMTVLVVGNLVHADPTVKNEYDVKIVLPINVIGKADSHVKLLGTIPGDLYRMLKPENSRMMEFVKKTDIDDYKWSEIITFAAMVGVRQPASVITGFIRDGIKRSAQNVTVLEDKSENFGCYDKASLAMVYTFKRPELLIVRAYSGPYDTALYQHSFALTSAVTPQNCLSKAAAFEKENIAVMKGE